MGHPGELATLVSVWRETREPRVAELIEVIAEAAPPAGEPMCAGRRKAEHEAWLARAHDDEAEALPLLLPGLTTGTSKQGVERLAALEDDPRLGTALLALLVQPPFSSNSTRAFWRALLARMLELGDTRHIDALAELGPHYNARMPGGVGMWLGNQITKTAAKLQAQREAGELDPSPLADTQREQVEALEFEHRKALAARAQSRAQIAATAANEDELIAAIRAQPGEDGPRHVYADWLLARGDPFGNVLAAALAGQPHEFSDEQELRQLGSLGGVASMVGFERGFPAVIGLWQNKRQLPKSVGQPEWATVHELRVGPWFHTDPPTQRVLKRLAVHPIMRSLRAVSGPSPEIMTELIEAWGPERSAKIQQWGARGLNRSSDVDTLLGLFDSLPGLEGLDLGASRLLNAENLTRIAAQLNTLMCGAPLELRAALDLLDASPLHTLWWQRDRRERPARVSRGADGRLSRVAIGIVHTYPKRSPYPLESVLRLIESLQGRPVERFEQIPLLEHRPMFRLLSAPNDHLPDDAARDTLDAALAKLAPKLRLELNGF